MDLTVEMVTKKVKKKAPRGKGSAKGGRGAQMKTVTREEECKSFFNFFSPPDLEDMGDEDEEEDEMEERAALIDLDFEIGMIFSKQIVKGAWEVGWLVWLFGGGWLIVSTSCTPNAPRAALTHVLACGGGGAAYSLLHH